MINLTPRAMVARAHNGFLVFLLRTDGPRLVCSLTLEHALAVLAAELRRGADEAAAVAGDVAVKERELRVVAETLHVTVDQVREALKTQLGIDKFASFEGDA